MQQNTVVSCRQWMRFAGGVLVAAALAAPVLVSAQGAWSPTKNVEFVIGAGPGAAADLTARTIQRIVQERKFTSGTSTVVNKPGASYALSWIYLNQHPRDAHYLAITTLALLTNAITGVNPLTYTDVTPIAQLFTDYVVLAVRADSQIRSGKGLVDYLKPNPNAASLGIAASLGNQNHIAAALALKVGGVDVTKLKVVVFESSSSSVINLLGGHIDSVAATALNIAPHVASGKLRAIAVSSPQRLPGTLADVPTWTEQGYAAVFGNWRGVVGPKGLGPAQVAYWEQVFAKLVKTDEWKREMDKNFWSDFYLGSRDSQSFLEKENATLRGVLTDLGLAK